MSSEHARSAARDRWRNYTADGIASPLHPLVLTMCDKITIGEKTLDTIRELRAALPTAEIIKSPHYIALPPDDSCLCGVDICATLVQAGCDYDHEPGSGRWGVWPDGVTGLREHARSTAAN